MRRMQIVQQEIIALALHSLSFDLFSESNSCDWNNDLRTSLMSPAGPFISGNKTCSQRYTLESDDSCTHKDTPKTAEREKLDNCVWSHIGEETIKW